MELAAHVGALVLGGTRVARRELDLAREQLDDRARRDRIAGERRDREIDIGGPARRE
jgi:hypothetical protein